MKNMLLSTSKPTNREVLNLRPFAGGALRPVGSPLLLPLAYRMPIGALTIGGLRKLISAGGSTLYSHPTTSVIGQPVAIGTAPAAPDCALSLSDDRLLVMTTRGAAEVRASGTQVAVSYAPQYKNISLTATVYGPLSETVEGLSMDAKEEDLYARVEAVESKLLSKGKAARAALHRRATVAGRYSCPVVCGYRLRNHQGDEIFRSQPFLLGNPTDESSIDLYSPDNVTIKSWEQSINTWKMHLRADASAELAATVGSLEVLALPQLHDVDPTQGGSVVLTRHTSSSLPFARLRLSEGLGDSYQSGRVSALAARLFDSGAVIHAVCDPFGKGVDTDLDCGANPSYAADYASMVQKLSTKLPSIPSYPECNISLPHSFTATCCCRSGDTVLWGDVSAVAYRGYSPEMLAASFGESQSWSYSMLIVLADGRKVFSEGTSSGPLPTKLNALISYPHAEAQELRLRISWNGGAWGRSFTLRPSACGRFAYFLSSDRAPVAVENNGGLTIANPGSDITRMSNVVVAARTSAPTVALSCIELPDGAVRAIVERPGNDTAWDHTRSRFFIGTRGSVHAIGVYLNGTRPTHTLRRVATSGIRSRGCLVAIDEGAAVLLEVPQGALPVVITKNGAVRPLCAPMAASNMAYNPIERELLVHGNGVTRVFCADYDWNWYHRNDISIQDVAHIDGLPYGIMDKGVYSLALEQPYAGTRHIALERDEHPGGRGLRRVRDVQLGVSGSDVTLGLDIRRIEPDGLEKEPILKCGLSGRVRRNPRLLLASRPLRALRWNLSGEVDNSFIFKSLNFTFDEY